MNRRDEILFAVGISFASAVAASLGRSLARNLSARLDRQTQRIEENTRKLGDSSHA